MKEESQSEATDGPTSGWRQRSVVVVVVEVVVVVVVLYLCLCLYLLWCSHIQTSKTDPKPSGFHTFDLDMCFAPQWRALFRHRIAIESSSNRKKVVRACGVLNIFTSKCASHHNGVHFFDIIASKSVARPEVLDTLTSKSNPQTPSYKREPFPTHSGKK